MANPFVPINIAIEAYLQFSVKVRWGLESLAQRHTAGTFKVYTSENLGVSWTLLSETSHDYCFVSLKGNPVQVKVCSVITGLGESAYCTPLVISLETDKVQTTENKILWGDVSKSGASLLDVGLPAYAGKRSCLLATKTDIDGIEWLDTAVFGGVPGAVGPQGEQGEQGPRGATGAQGPQGAQGPAGARGAEGPIGLTGPRGIQGETGPTGVRGITGAQGIQGIQGATGAQGETGPTGPTGETGERGVQGIQGIQGAQGPTGAQGAVGPEGPAGPEGEMGPAGANGSPILWKGALASAPAFPLTNWAYYNTADKISYVYSNSAWYVLAQDGTDGVITGGGLYRYQVVATAGEETAVLATGLGITASRATDTITFVLPEGVHLVSTKIRWPAGVATTAKIRIGTVDCPNNSAEDRWPATVQVFNAGGTFVGAAGSVMDQTNFDQTNITGLTLGAPYTLKLTF